MATGITCIACSVFCSVLESLRAAGEFDLPVRYLDSMLHIWPEKHRPRLEALVQDEREAP